MAATTSLLPVSLELTLSHTSRINSQFSEVRFSSVALAIRTVNTRHSQALINLLTDGVVKDILLGPKHDQYDVKRMD